MTNINDTYFDSHYKEIWRSLIPEVLTAKEIDFMIPYFNLQPGCNVLDLMCGYGRHALALGRKDIHVTAIDNLPAYIEEISKAAAAESLPVSAVQMPVLDYIPDKDFNLAICMGNSLNFFSAGDVVKIFSMVSSCLKPGGHFMINSWSIAEIVYRNFKENTEGMLGGEHFTTNMRLLFQPARVEAVTTFTAPGGQKETKEGIDYIYSLNELNAFCSSTGLKLKKVYSIPGKKEFSLGEPRAYIIAEKI